ncbi:MAG: GNAT family protein [Actinomycetota bacterium]|nr:GNAT family protein [Actinomycetota bacterium]
MAFDGALPDCNTYPGTRLFRATNGRTFTLVGLPAGLAGSPTTQIYRAGGSLVAIAMPGNGRGAGHADLIMRPRVEQGATQAPGDGELVFRAHAHVAGVGYWIAPFAQGHGLATRATALISRWGVETARLVRIEALVDPVSVASGRVVKAGFQR